MRTTTKIVIGIILSIFVLFIGLIIGLSFIGKKIEPQPNPTFSENMRSIRVNSYKTIQLDLEPMQQEVCNVFLSGKLSLVPMNGDNESDNFSFPEESSDFFTVNSVNDTLFIKINQEKLHAKFGVTGNRKYPVSVSGLVFELKTNHVDVINNIDNIGIEIKDIKTDKIRIKSEGGVFIENCKADAVEPQMINDSGFRDFLLKNSQVKKLNIDLDYMSNWRVENCEIEEENLTGSRDDHHNQLQNSKVKTINWFPKNSDARLNINLPGNTTRIVFP